MLLELFNVPPGDYKKLLAFLRKHQCHMPFQKFRSIAVRPEAIGIVGTRIRGNGNQDHESHSVMPSSFSRQPATRH
jgi:hypothetical protein